MVRSSRSGRVSSSILQTIQVYVTGKALTILGGTDNLIQTIYHNDCDALDAVSVDERTGKIATASGNKIYVYDASCSGRNVSICLFATITS